MNNHATLPLLALVAAIVLSGNALAADDMMKKMDADGDGKVTANEHAAGAKAMFDGMDADRNGTVTVAEMDAHHAGMAKQAAKGDDDKWQMSSAEKIKVVDTNGDGSLSTDEHAAGSASMFARMDANQDGGIDPAEMQAGHQSMMQKK